MNRFEMKLAGRPLVIENGQLAKQANGAVLVRYGDTGHANLHYCDWIRQWTDTCLRIYGVLSVRNPGFLERFAERKGLS